MTQETDRDFLVQEAEEVAELIFQIKERVEAFVALFDDKIGHTAFPGLAADLLNLEHRAHVNVELCRRDPLEDARKAFREMAAQSGLSPEEMKAVLETLRAE